MRKFLSVITVLFFILSLSPFLFSQTVSFKGINEKTKNVILLDSVKIFNHFSNSDTTIKSSFNIDLKNILLSISSYAKANNIPLITDYSTNTNLFRVNLTNNSLAKIIVSNYLGEIVYQSSIQMPEGSNLLKFTGGILPIGIYFINIAVKTKQKLLR